jgi:Lon protease-like protein
MPDVPDAWPPSGAAPRSLVLPVFPLPNVWLYPGVAMPLNIFEPRYRQMVEESLDGPGRLVIATVLAGHESRMLAAPPFYPVAGLGEIGRHERLPDGRFNIWVVGLARVLVREVKSDRPYRRVEAEPVEESEPPKPRAAALRKTLVSAILERRDQQVTIPPGVPIGSLADLLALCLPLPHKVRNRLFAELDHERRATLALAEHATRPKKGSEGKEAG